MVSESLSHHSSCSTSSMEFSHLSPEIYSENRVLIHCIFYCKSHIETTSYILLHNNQFGRIHSIALLHICLLLCSGDFNGQDHRCEAATLRQHRHVCHHKLLFHTWGECQSSHGVAAKSIWAGRWEKREEISEEIEHCFFFNLRCVLYMVLN
jgi:hypothetical protein